MRVSRSKRAATFRSRGSAQTEAGGPISAPGDTAPAEACGPQERGYPRGLKPAARCPSARAEARGSRHHDLAIVAGMGDVLRTNNLDSLDALFNVSNADKLSKPGLDPWRERLRLTLDVYGEQRTFYLKRFHNPPLKARREMRRSVTGASSLAGMEWTWMHRLAADGISCVKPIAFGEQFRGAKELRSAILMEAVPGASLEYWVDQWGEDDRPTIRSLVQPLAALVARLHERGYIHRDLYLSHVFHDPASPPEASLHLIDLQRVIRPRWRHRRWIIKDLASLNFSAPPHLVSKTDRLRWLTHYLGSPKLDASAKRLAYRIVGKTQRIGDHQRHRAARWQTGSKGS
ncbi:MAG: lipopolysaccharide kinase InaA family protein [Phycisphaerae bacterium]